MTYDAGKSVGSWDLNTTRGDAAIQRSIALLKRFEEQQKRAFAVRPPPTPQPPPAPRPAAARQPTEEEIKYQNALARTAEAEAKRINATTRKTAADNAGSVAAARQATEEQRLATETARTAKAKDQAAVAALRRQQAEARASRQGENDGLGPALPRTLAGFTGALGTAVNGFLAIKAATASLDFLRTAAQVDDARRSLDGLAASAKTTGDAIITSLRDAAQGTITDAELIKAANTGLLLTQGRITKDLPQLVQIARASAKATGQDVGFVFDSLVRGIARGSPMIIDNAGITLDAAGAFATYAKSVGKSSDELTKQEQQQATLNAVLTAGADIVKQVGLDADSSATKIDTAVTAVNNLGTALLTKVAPFVGSAAQGLTNLLNTGQIRPDAAAAGEDVNAKIAGRAQSFEEYSRRVADANQAAYNAVVQYAGVGGLFEYQQSKIQALTQAQFAYAQSLVGQGQSEQQALAAARARVDVLNQLGPVIDAASTGDAELRANLYAQIPALAAVASGTEDEKQAVLDLVAARGQGIIGNQEFYAELTKLVAEHDKAAEAAAQEERETRNLARTFGDVAPAASAAASAIAGLQSVMSRNVDFTAGFRNGVGGAMAGLAGGAGGDTRVIDQATALRKSELDLAYASAKSDKERIAVLRQELALTTDQIEKNSILARIEGLKRSQSGGAGGRGLSGLDRTDIELAGDLEAQLDEVNRQLEKGNLTQLQRNQLLVKQQDLEEKISAEQDKRARAAVDAELGRVRDAEARLKEQREAAGLERALQSGRLNARETESAQLRLREIGLEQQKRALDIQRDAKAAGDTAAAAPPPGPQPPPAPTPPARPGAAITAPLPLPNIPTLPPTIAPVVNLSLTIALDPATGRASVVNPPPGINVLDILTRASQARG